MIRRIFVSNLVFVSSLAVGCQMVADFEKDGSSSTGTGAAGRASSAANASSAGSGNKPSSGGTSSASLAKTTNSSGRSGMEPASATGGAGGAVTTTIAVNGGSTDGVTTTSLVNEGGTSGAITNVVVGGRGTSGGETPASTAHVTSSGAVGATTASVLVQGGSGGAETAPVTRGGNGATSATQPASEGTTSPASCATVSCGANAACALVGSAPKCQCNVGYTGDGLVCTDVDECKSGTHNCGANGLCANTAGAFTCTCKSGYTGDGRTCTCAPNVCTAECPCSTGQGPCTAKSSCSGSLQCASGAGSKFGFAGNACVPSHCDNDVVDADETSIDCGGECGCRAEFIALGDLPGGTFGSTAYSVSRNGDVVVGIGTTDDEATHSFIWKSSVLSQIPLQIPGLQQDYAYAVSDDGTVVAGWASVTGVSAGLGWVWSASGGTIVNAQVSSLNALSGDGKVAAGYYFKDRVYSSPLAFTITNSTIRPLSTLPAHDTNSNPLGASRDGQIFVGRCGSTRAEATPCRWDAAGVPTMVGDLPGGDSYGEASDVNDDGTVVVGNSSSSSGSQAFHYDGSRTYGLGFLPGGTSSTACGVSGDGRFVVGTASSNDGNGAFLWDEQGGMRSLVDELRSRGYELPNTWKVRSANGISGDGKSIVGAATNPSGNNEAFLVRLK